MLEEVRHGLSLSRKRLPSTYFYDERGSRLFEEITRLPEYYLTRAERSLLRAHIPAWTASLRPGTLVELGAGSAAKTRIILDAMVSAGSGRCYVPVDVSASFLAETARRIEARYGGLEVTPAVADITQRLELPTGLPGPVLHAFLGSTIGNFEDHRAVEVLGRVRAAMAAPDALLLGVDLRKDPARIEAAYDDPAGVTAEFNRNVLRVLNRELGADFDPGSFHHRAFYDPGRHRVEMHLVSEGAQEVTVPGVGAFRFEDGESVRTEISTKYDREAISSILEASGLRVDRWEARATDAYALLLASPA